VTIDNRDPRQSIAISAAAHVTKLHEVLLTSDGAGNNVRTIVGFVGAPGVGKSTIAAHFVESLRAAGHHAVLVPMDGFHLANAELQRLGCHDRKGAPDTFDVGGFVALLDRIRTCTDQMIWAPVFHREIEESIAAELVIEPRHRIVVTEGNYLLHDQFGWEQVQSRIDHTWFIRAVDDADRKSRLIARHVGHGRSEDAARLWVRTVDEPNAHLINQRAKYADREILLSPWP
jgi:pantothenate kinase